MKETWLYYDYLRRWGWLMVLAAVVGVLIGFAYYSNQPHAVNYRGTAKVSLLEVGPETYSLPTQLASFIIDLGTWPTQAEATEYAYSTARQISSPGIPAQITQLSSHKSPIGGPAWKAMVLGGVVGTLFAILIAYVWDDAKTYVKHLQEQQKGSEPA